MELQTAFNEWTKLAGVACNCAKHSSSRFASEGFLIDPAPDTEVCAREKAWRRYVELRDGKVEGWASTRRLRPYRRELQ